MARKKRKFIDKKNAVSFKLVERSQNDPLFVDESAPQYVLVEKQSKQEVHLDDDVDVDDGHGEHDECKPSTSKPTVVDRRAEQIKFGIYYDDDYDYLQHLVDVKELPTAVGIQVQPKEAKVAKGGLMLPSSVFESTVQEKVDLSKKAALPVGPQLDWDPDIVQAMDDDFDFDDPENQMEDDFVLKAMQTNSSSNAGAGGDDLDAFENDYKYDFSYKNTNLMPVPEGQDGEDGADENDDAMSDADNLSLCGYVGSDEDEEDESRDRFELNSVQAKLMDKRNIQRYFGLDERDDAQTCKTSASTHFTEYSMSSSILPRNDQLKLLDEKFEQMYIREYADDTAIGALECEDIAGSIDPNHSRLMQCLVDEFQEAKAGPVQYEPNPAATQYLRQFLHSHQRSHCDVDRDRDGSSSTSSDTEEEEEEVITLVDPGRKGDPDRADCESVLSTMSNTLYHPRVLRETDRYGNPLVARCRASAATTTPRNSPIRIDPKTGIPTVSEPVLSRKRLEALDGARSTGSHLSRITELSVRPRHETAEQRKTRKKELKEYRAARRAEKKANRVAFGAESQKLHRTELNKAVQKKIAVI